MRNTLFALITFTIIVNIILLISSLIYVSDFEEKVMVFMTCLNLSSLISALVLIHGVV